VGRKEERLWRRWLLMAARTAGALWLDRLSHDHHVAGEFELPGRVT
jgi:hypothetical protein